MTTMMTNTILICFIRLNNRINVMIIIKSLQGKSYVKNGKTTRVNMYNEVQLHEIFVNKIWRREILV